MKKLVSVFVVSFMFLSVHGQTFQWGTAFNSIGSNYGAFVNEMAVDANGNIYTSSETGGTTDFDPGPSVYNLSATTNSLVCVVSKLDSNGNFIWALGIGGVKQGANVNARTMHIDFNGNVFLVGEFTDTIDFDPSLNTANLVAQSGSDVFIAKYDVNGNYLWAKSIGGTNSQKSEGISVDNMGNVYVSGTFKDTVDFDPGVGSFVMVSQSSWYYDMFILKLNSSGAFVWAKQLSGAWSITPKDIQCFNNHIYLSGNWAGTCDFNPGTSTYNMTSASASTSDIFLLKLTSNGGFSWSKQIAGVGVNKFKMDNNGNLYLAGGLRGTADIDPGIGTYYLTANTSYDGFIAKLDSNAILNWGRVLGGNSILGFVQGKDYTSSVDIDNAGNVYSVGSFIETGDFNHDSTIYPLVTNPGENAIVVCKHDLSGNLMFAGSINGVDDLYPMAIACNNNGGLYAGGYFNDSVDMDPGPGIAMAYSNPAPDILIFNWEPCGSPNYLLYQNCDSLTLNGYTHTKDSSWIQFYNDINGCDSNQVFNVRIDSTYSNTYIINACDSFLFNGNTLLTSGTYIDTFLSSGSCDSVVTINLTINNSITNTITQSGCDSLTINGQTYTSSGTYTQQFTNVQSCDSIVTLNLTINNSSTNTITQTGCDSLTINGQTYTSSGSYTQMFTNAVGCDSIVTLNLTINNSTSNSITQTGCDSLTINGQTYTASGTYSQTLTNANSCDSNLTLILTINNSTSNTITQTGCDSLTINGQTYTSSGTYNQTLTNANNCDSNLTLNLTINNSSSNTITQTSCNPITINSQTYNTTGTYYQTLTNAQGCDSILTLNLTINGVSATATQNALVLTASPTGAAYQWLECNPYAIISGATNQSYTVTANGDYAVMVTQNNCSDTSNCININNVGIDNVEVSGIRIYPNPTEDNFYLETDIDWNSLEIISMQGQTVLSFDKNHGSQFSLETLPSGPYIVKIKTDTGNFLQKILKE